MQHFKDSNTGDVYAYDDDVVVATGPDGILLTTASGMPISAPADLRPYTPQAPTVADAKVVASAAMRAKRDAALAASDWLVERHRDEVDIDASKTTLTVAQYRELLAYRATLRNIPEQKNFPDVTLPNVPVFV